MSGPDGVDTSGAGPRSASVSQLADAGSAYEGPAYARVALPIPVPRLFDYAVPPALARSLAPGCRVLVPFGRGHATQAGFVVELASASEVDPARIKPVARQLDPRPVLSAALLELARWIATYYCCSWGEALEAALPGGVAKSLVARTRQVVELAQDDLATDRLIAEKQDRHPAQARVLRLVRESGGRLSKLELARRCQTSLSPVESLLRAGALRIAVVRADVDPLDSALPAPAPPAALTSDQVAALARIEALLDAKAFAVALLHGVTGSGKTEVYLRAIERVLAAGGSAIVLIPEIALTPQTVSRFRARFREVAILHSALSGTQRHDQWSALERGEARVAIGPRSAVFAPVRGLALVIVDEEHEPTYKQQSVPRYHARDVAVMRAKLEGAVVVLGSATPALETHHNAACGKYERLSLPRRVMDRPLPPVKIVDMKGELGTHGQPKLFSHALAAELKDVLARREQAILLLNRRGYATHLSCPRCEHVHQCARCAVSMTYHQKLGRVVCHHCLAEAAPPFRCPACDSPRYRYSGAGTQKLEDELDTQFPGIRYARMDSDSMVTSEHYEEVLGRFGAGEVDVLLGTQMIAKGLDFPRVALVGVLAADLGMALPDFRAAERTFQLIAQVGGRAGRGDVPGRVIVQTRAPGHYAIVAAASHDYAAFVDAELGHRRAMGYPPYARLVRIVLEDPDLARVNAVAAAIRDALADGLVHEVELLGPAAAPIELLRDRHRVQLLLKSPSQGPLLALRARLAELGALAGSSHLAIDVDPVSMM